MLFGAGVQAGRPGRAVPRRTRWWWGGGRWWWGGGAGLRRSRVLCRRRQGERAEIRRPGRSAAAIALRLRPSLTPESARGAPAWPARSSGRPGAPSQGQGFAAHPVAVALHGLGMEAGPRFQVRPGAASAPPAEPAFGAGCSLPAPGADGTTVRASQPLNLARREAGRGRAPGDDDAVAVESVAITADEDRTPTARGRPGAVVHGSCSIPTRPQAGASFDPPGGRRHPRALAGKVGFPIVHEAPPPLEQVRPCVRRLDFVADDVDERRLDDLARLVRLLGRPVTERRPEAMGHGRDVAVLEDPGARPGAGCAAGGGDVNGWDCRTPPVPVRCAIPESGGRPASRERGGRPGRPVQAGPQGP